MNSRRQFAKSVLREPLLHFILGALLIYIYMDAFSPTSNATGDSNIVISATKLSSLKNDWVRRWRVDPTPAELQALIQGVVDDEIYLREALRLGLDQGDSVVKNRMIQKMRFLADQSISEPNESQLKAWLAKNPKKYSKEVSLSFTQVYLGNSIDLEKAKGALSQLNSEGLDYESFSKQWRQKIGLPSVITAQTRSAVERTFGVDFTSTLIGLPRAYIKGQHQPRWQGLVQSGFGYHVVKLESIGSEEEGGLTDPALRNSVRNDWIDNEKQEAERKALSVMRDRYTITISEVE